MRSTTHAIFVIAALSTANAYAGTQTARAQAIARPVTGATHYSQPDLRLAGYDSILIDDVTLTYDETSAHRDSKSGEQRISDATIAVLRTAVGERFAIATEAGPGTIRLRAAINDVRAEKKPRRFWQYTPVGLIKHRVDSARGTDVTLYGATVEIELADALTGELLATVVDTDSYGSWRNVVARLDWWVRHIIDDPRRWA